MSKSLTTLTNGGIVNSTYDSSSLSSTAMDTIRESENDTGTKSQYDSDLRIFERWLAYKSGADVEKATFIDIINFMADQYNGVLTKYIKADIKSEARLVDGGMISPITIDRRRWGIIKSLASRQVVFPQDQLNQISEYVRLLKKKTDQANPSRKRGQSAALRWEDIKRMLNSPLMETKTEFVRLRDKAILAMLSVTGARESELLGEFGVRIKDFVIRQDIITYHRVVKKRGSFDYSFKGAIDKGDDPTACPVQIITSYINYVKKLEAAEPSTKLFIQANRLGQPNYSRKPRKLTPLGPRIVDDLLRDYAMSSGISGERLYMVSGHSVRIGLVVRLVELGWTYEQISKVTGQSVQTVERYAQQAQLSPFKAQ